ncbi:hypothetical protein Aduo_018881 [Ancylostoma duodenale]
MEEFPCGKTAAKNKGRRVIVIGAITVKGVVPGCTRVSRGASLERDYHRNMNYSMFEEYPTDSSTKAANVDYLRSKGVEIAVDSSKEDLLQELHAFVSSRVEGLRNYAVENICAEFGVGVIREEEAARLKIAVDFNNKNNIGSEEYLSSSDDSSSREEGLSLGSADGCGLSNVNM